MTEDNTTAVLYGVNDLRLEQRPIPVPGNDQVLLKMQVVGICGSDIHYWTNGRIGPFVVKKPMIIGHEASGTVVQVGKHVTHLKVGDNVAIEPGHGCRKCTYCKTGKYNLCPDMKFCATPPYDGNLCRFYVHDADFCFKLPENVTLEEGALMEPLSIGVRACKRGEVKFGDRCLIFGAGPIGLVTLLAAKAMGATKILVTDIIDEKLTKAKSIGATHILNTKGLKEEEIIVAVKNLIGEEPSVSFDCCGMEQCIRVGLQVTKPGGVLVLVGMGKDEMTLPITIALIREVDIRGIFRYVNDYQTSIEMVSSKTIDVTSLITHRFKIEDTVKAFTTAKTGEGNPIKILIYANPQQKHA